MKVTIDLDKLLEEGRITRDEYDKFSRLAARGTSALAFNILVGFGVIAVSGAALALLPTAMTAIAVGLLISAAGIGLTLARSERWTVLANICIVVGALLFGGGIVALGGGSAGSFLLIAAVFGVAGVAARSALLVVLSVLALSSCLGARTGYFHAAYFLGIEAPTLTVVLFTVFSSVVYQLSKRLAGDFRGLAIVAARTGVFLVNVGFWVGSLWGDRLHGGAIVVPDWLFALLWAIALIAAGVWALRRNRRWMINVVAVFAAIHFYTQWFERLGASAQTVLLAGLLTIAVAVWLRALNARLGRGA